MIPGTFRVRVLRAARGVPSEYPAVSITVYVLFDFISRCFAVAIKLQRTDAT